MINYQTLVDMGFSFDDKIEAQDALNKIQAVVGNRTARILMDKLNEEQTKELNEKSKDVLFDVEKWLLEQFPQSKEIAKKELEKFVDELKSGIDDKMRLFNKELQKEKVKEKE